MDKKKRFSIRRKMYLFVGITVFLATFGLALLAFYISSDQIDRYFKNLTLTSARNFASFVDVDYFKKLREMAESEEYQALRDKAEAEDDETAIEEYIRAQGLWEGYVENRNLLVRYLRNMDDIKYLYIVAWGGVNDTYDMYLMDDDENPIYMTGYYELREEELKGVDASVEVEPTISHGDWGWLCSAYVPLYDSEGKLVCQVGCDVGMDDIMKERRVNLMYMIFGAILLTIIVLSGANFLMNRSIIKPLKTIMTEMKKFKPERDSSYDDAGVIRLDIHSNDEIEDIYQGIRSMQINIVDYLNDIVAIQKDKERAENDVRDKEKQIGRISAEAYKDPLTQVGSKVAYVKKIEEMNRLLSREDTQFAIVMVDVNNLKMINDTYGHTYGDDYLRGCCRVICNVYKHSPVYRIGGDEFVVFVSGEDYEVRHEKLSALKKSYESTCYDKNLDPWRRYSAAMGMAEYAHDDNTVELVFKRADKAMYLNKQEFKKGELVNGI